MTDKYTAKAVSDYARSISEKVNIDLTVQWTPPNYIYEFSVKFDAWCIYKAYADNTSKFYCKCPSKERAKELAQEMNEARPSDNDQSCAVTQRAG